jgi:hypothetical protein
VCLAASSQMADGPFAWLSLSLPMNPLEKNMRKRSYVLFGILALISAAGLTMAVPAEAAELYVPRAYKARPAHLFSYPYGGTYLRVDLARRRLGYPYVGYYYGNYYAPTYAYSYAPAHWNYYDPFYRDYSSGCYPSRRCPGSL